MLDERGTLRRHLDGVRTGISDQGALVAPDDQVMVMAPGASAEAADHVELLVGAKGLVVLSGERGAELAVSDRTFVGTPVEYAVRDRRAGHRAGHGAPYAGRARALFADDPGGTWRGVETAPAFPADADAAVERVWVITPGKPRVRCGRV